VSLAAGFAYIFLMTPPVSCHGFCGILVFHCPELRRLMRSWSIYWYSVWSFIIPGWIMEAQTVILMASLQLTKNVLSGAFYVAVQYV